MHSALPLLSEIYKVLEVSENTTIHLFIYCINLNSAPTAIKRLIYNTRYIILEYTHFQGKEKISLEINRNNIITML